MDEIEIKRSFKPSHFGKIVSAQIHHFSDASEVGYCEASYLPLLDDQGQISNILVMAKSRVAPLKTFTIPRLELTAATVAVKVGYMLFKELQISDLQECYWTDSQLVLQYLGNEKRRFDVFVANRAKLIHDYTDVDQWRHVKSKNNPADHAS